MAAAPHFPLRGWGVLLLCASFVAACATPAPPTASPGVGQPLRRLSGMYTYMADAAVFVECTSGTRLPVAQEGDSAALESAYMSARPAPGAALLATVEARVLMRQPMEGDVRPTLVVERFIAVSPEPSCGAAATAASLENTYWKLTTLRGKPVEVTPQQQEPHFILQPAQKRVVGSGGCNRFTGSYALDGERLSFGRTAGTMAACLQGMELERAFLDALPAVVRWRIDGQRLELLDERGVAIGQFESRDLQ